jgi:predicted metal-dependent peptidase
VLVHEIYHVILKHHLREELDPIFKEKHFKFNVAADYALNPMVVADGRLALPDGCLLDLDRFPDDLVEQIFASLTDDEIEDLKKQFPGTPGAGGGGGRAIPGEVRPFKKGETTEAERDQAGQEIDQWINAAGMKANNAGKYTQGEQRLLKQVVTPTVNWQDELQFICEDITRDDYTWKMPNPRYMAMGAYLPTLTGHSVPDMVIFVDTSGSLDDKMLAEIMAEVRNIITTFNMRVIVIYWDTEFQHQEIFDAEDVLDPEWSLDAHGGGGTTFTGVVKHLDTDEFLEQDIDPAAVVFFTDTETTDWPDDSDEPDMPWLWCQVPDSDNHFEERYHSHMPDWGRHVTVDIYHDKGQLIDTYA